MIGTTTGSTAAPWWRLRRLLLVASLAGFAGTGAELLLLGHTEGWQQLAPIVLLALALTIFAWQIISSTRASSTRAASMTLKAAMWLCVISGAAGVVLHYQGNAAFEREMYPEMRGLELFSETMTGATPVLAPGTMTLLGLVGLAYAFAAEAQAATRESPSEDEQ